MRVNRHAIAVGFLVLLTLGAYAPVFHNDFVNYDDDTYVTGNETVRAGVTADGIRWALGALHGSNWHPLTWFSHMVDVELYGLEPAGHHVTNVLLHVANTLLVYALLVVWTGAGWRSAVVAALFAVHPLHVESVAWVAERKDLLSTLLGLGAMLSYTGFARRDSRAAYVGALVLFALSLTAKPMLVTMPFLLLLIDAWPLGRLEAGTWRRRIVEKLPFLALAVGSALITLLAQRPSLGNLETYSIGVRLSNALVSWGAYLWKTLWPVDLAVFYPHPRAVQPVAAALSVAVLVSISWIAWWRRGDRPALAWGWLWYVVTLIPVIGLVQTGAQSMADRYAYVPLIGIFVAVLGSVPDPEKLSGGRRATWAGVVLVLVALLAVLTHRQAGYWRTSESLFRHALEVIDDSHVAHLNLALALTSRGDHEEALHHLDEAVRIRGDLAQIHNDRAVVLERLGRKAEAVHALVRTLELDAVRGEAAVMLGGLLVEAGHADRAEAVWRRALEFDAENVALWYNLGTLVAASGRHEEALPILRRAVDLDPEHAMARYNLGQLLVLTGRAEEGRRHMDRAREIGYSLPR